MTQIPDTVREQVERLTRLAGEAQEAEQTWIRLILSLAAGAFALLAGIQPEVPPEGDLVRIILAATWGCMGLGILFGAVATYVGPARKQAIALSMAEAIKVKLEGGRPSDLLSAPVSPIYPLSKALMVISLLSAVVGLTLYAILSTMAYPADL